MLVAFTPLGRRAEPHEVAPMILFLVLRRGELRGGRQLTWSTEAWRRSMSPTPHEIVRARRLRARLRHDAARRAHRLRHLRHAQRGARQRRRASRAGSSAATPTIEWFIGGADSRSTPRATSSSRPACSQRPLHLAVEHPGPLRPRRASRRSASRTMSGPSTGSSPSTSAQPASSSSSAARWAPSRPIQWGLAIPTSSSGSCRTVRGGAVQPALLRLPRRRQGRAAGRSRLCRRRLRRAARARAEGDRPRVGRAGRCRRPSTAEPLPPDGPRHARRFLVDFWEAFWRRAATPTTCSASWRPGSRPTSPRRRAMTATSPRRWARSAPRPCCARARRTSTSRRRTWRGRPRRCRMPSSA